MKEEGIKLYKTIFDQTPISTQIFTPDGETIMVNKAWKHLWNAKFDGPPEYNILKDKQLVETGTMPYIKRAFKGEVVSLPAIRYEPAKSVSIKGLVSYRWLSARMYSIRDKKGNISYVVLQHEDITERKISEEALRTSEERLRLALDSGNIGVWDWDIKNKVLTWTDNVYKIHGVNKKNFDLTLETYMELIHPEDRKMVKRAIRNTLKTNEEFKIELRVIGHDKCVRWVTTSATVIHDASNKPERMLGATSEITQQKLIDQEKSDFLSMASHELKTPITSLNMFVDLLSSQQVIQKPEKTEYLVNKIKDQTSRLMDLTNDLLDVSRIETGKLKLNKKKFNLTELVIETVEGLQATTNHKLVVKGDKKIFVVGDRYRIFQVLINLITNAIKYSPENKRITITITQKDKIIISVKDSGIGIAKDKQKRIFERLYQVTDPTEKTYPGLGLGLYISKEILERHNGEIWVKSDKGKGSTFYFSLPTNM